MMTIYMIIHCIIHCIIYREGEDVSLVCSSEGARPAAVLAWYNGTRYFKHIWNSSIAMELLKKCHILKELKVKVILKYLWSKKKWKWFYNEKNAQASKTYSNRKEQLQPVRNEASLQADGTYTTNSRFDKYMQIHIHNILTRFYLTKPKYFSI